MLPEMPRHPAALTHRNCNFGGRKQASAGLPMCLPGHPSALEAGLWLALLLLTLRCEDDLTKCFSKGKQVPRERAGKGGHSPSGELWVWDLVLNYLLVHPRQVTSFRQALQLEVGSCIMFKLSLSYTILFNSFPFSFFPPIFMDFWGFQ